jgi:hypothetical protein
VDQNKAVVAPNVSVSTLFAINAVSPTLFLLSHSRAARFCAVIVSAPAAPRIAGLDGVRVPTLVGLFFLQNPNEVGALAPARTGEWVVS